jgi:hypothetical protein
MTNTRAFNALLFVQWKQQRIELALLAIWGAIVAPIAIWAASSTSDDAAAWELLNAAETVAGFGGVLAAITGVLLAIRPFWLDARANHIYALALPVPRARYARFRIGSGVLLSLIPTLGFLIGALVAVQAAPRTTLHAYPVGLTARFFLATMTAFAFAFAIQYGLGRKTLRWILIVVATIGSVELAGQITMHVSLASPFFELVRHESSPLAVFWNRWMLFDV